MGGITFGRTTRASVAIVLVVLPGVEPVHAAEVDLEEVNAPSVEIHGFVSQGFIKTTHNNYLALSERGSFEFAEAGINFTVPLDDRFRVGMQLFARDLGPSENYDARFDWFYLDYRFFDWLGIRAGRAKLPFGLYNEVNDVDSARVPVLLPQSIYPTTSRDFLLAVTGLQLYGYWSFPIGGGLDYRAYAGTNFLATSTQPNAISRPVSVNTPYMAGGRILWETPVEGLRLGPSVQAIRIDGELLFASEVYEPLVMGGALTPDFDGLVDYELDATLGVLSVEYTHQDVALAAEYSRWWLSLEADVPALFPSQDAVSERFYAMASYRVVPWLTPGLYYSALFPDVEDRTGRDMHQHDFAATLRFDLLPYWLFKLEGHFIRGTADVSPSLNGGTPRDELQRDWGLFLAKTTAFF